MFVPCFNRSRQAPSLHYRGFTAGAARAALIACVASHIDANASKNCERSIRVARAAEHMDGAGHWIDAPWQDGYRPDCAT